MPGIEKLEWFLLSVCVVATLASMFTVKMCIRNAFGAKGDPVREQQVADLGAWVLFWALIAVFSFVAYMTVQPTKMIP